MICLSFVVYKTNSNSNGGHTGGGKTKDTEETPSTSNPTVIVSSWTINKGLQKHVVYF